MKMTLVAALVAATGTALLLGATAGPASADTRNTNGVAGTPYQWTTGSNTYSQNHNGDEFGFDSTWTTIQYDIPDGDKIYMRWVKCTDYSKYGSATVIAVSQGRRTLGTNFLPTTCLKSQFEPYNNNTTEFRGVMHWNYNWA